jgi:hypothetical protein
MNQYFFKIENKISVLTKKLNNSCDFCLKNGLGPDFDTKSSTTAQSKFS